MDQKLTTRSKLIYWLPTIIWATLIFLVSSRPSVETSKFYWQDFVLKKTAHFIEYAIFFTLVHRSLRHTIQLSRPRLIILALTITILYAISDEIHQTFVPTRTGRVRDAIIDTSGSLAALYLLNKYYP